MKVERAIILVTVDLVEGLDSLFIKNRRQSEVDHHLGAEDRPLQGTMASPSTGTTMKLPKEQR